MLQIIKKNQTLTIDSREVATIVEKDHSKLMRDIRTYLSHINDEKERYFIKNTYIDLKGEVRPCYLITILGVKLMLDNMRATANKSLLYNWYCNIASVQPIILYNRKEYQFGEMLDEITGMNWQRQYPINGGEYRLDFYFKDVLIVEYDEKHHTYKQKEDMQRIEYCREWLSKNESDGSNWRCPVIRVKEGQELEGINRIIRHIAGFEMFDTQYDYKLEVCDIGNKPIHI